MYMSLARKSVRLTSSQVYILPRKKNGRQRFEEPSVPNFPWLDLQQSVRLTSRRSVRSLIVKVESGCPLCSAFVGYSLFPFAHVGATHIAIFAAKWLLPYIKNVEKASVITGFNGTIANKGCCAVSFTLGATSFLFCSAHFDAHTHNLAARNECWRRIESELCKKLLKCREFPAAAMVNECFDRVVFMGDLNYRVTEDYGVVCEAISRKDMEYLLGLDQLRQVLAGDCDRYRDWFVFVMNLFRRC